MLPQGIEWIAIVILAILGALYFAYRLGKTVGRGEAYHEQLQKRP